MRFDSLIFDIDGTLWDATAGVAASFSEASKEFEFGEKHFTREMICSEVGQPLKTIFTDLYPELGPIIDTDPDRADKIMQRINTVSTRYEYAYLKEHGGSMFPGTYETLSQLSSRIPLFIVSNCEKGYIELMTESCGIQHFFKDWLCFGDTGQEKDVSMRILCEKYGLSSTAYIGDIKNDALSSRKAGIPFIWAAYGFGEVPQELYCEKINDIRELTKLIIG